MFQLGTIRESERIITPSALSCPQVRGIVADKDVGVLWLETYMKFAPSVFRHTFH